MEARKELDLSQQSLNCTFSLLYFSFRSADWRCPVHLNQSDSTAACVGQTKSFLLPVLDWKVRPGILWARWDSCSRSSSRPQCSSDVFTHVLQSFSPFIIPEASRPALYLFQCTHGDQMSPMNVLPCNDMPSSSSSPLTPALNHPNSQSVRICVTVHVIIFTKDLSQSGENGSPTQHLPPSLSQINSRETLNMAPSRRVTERMGQLVASVARGRPRPSPHLSLPGWVAYGGPGRDPFGVTHTLRDTQKAWSHPGWAHDRRGRHGVTRPLTEEGLCVCLYVWSHLGSSSTPPPENIGRCPPLYPHGDSAVVSAHQN